MATEIELKAHVDDPETLRARLTNLAEFAFSFEKTDAYWFPGEPQPGALCSLPLSGIRIRETVRAENSAWEGEGPGAGVPLKGKNEVTGFTEVNFKSKEVRNGIEVNDEREFTVSNRENFEELLRRLGLEPKKTKAKRGQSWNYGDMTVELSLVGCLGWFLEAEILAQDDRDETVSAARRRLLDFLEKTGIGKDKIETRYYTELLE